MTHTQINLLPASSVLKSLNEKQAFDNEDLKPSERELNQIGLWLLGSKEHGDWYQLLLTVYDPIRLAKALTEAGFIILTLKQTIFVLDRQNNETALKEKLAAFLKEWALQHKKTDDL